MKYEDNYKNDDVVKLNSNAMSILGTKIVDKTTN